MTKCARCCTGIAAHEMVMRARDLVYHLSCFTCTACNLALTPGDYFGMRDSHVYCRLHYETVVSPRRHGEQTPLHPHQQQQQQQQPPQHHPGLASNYQGPLTPGPSPPCASGPATFYNGMGVSGHKGRPRKRKGADSMGDYCRGKVFFKYLIPKSTNHLFTHSRTVIDIISSDGARHRPASFKTHCFNGKV